MEKFRKWEESSSNESCENFSSSIFAAFFSSEFMVFSSLSIQYLKLNKNIFVVVTRDSLVCETKKNLELRSVESAFMCSTEPWGELATNLRDLWLARGVRQGRCASFLEIVSFFDQFFTRISSWGLPSRATCRFHNLFTQQIEFSSQRSEIRFFNLILTQMGTHCGSFYSTLHSQNGEKARGYSQSQAVKIVRVEFILWKIKRWIVMVFPVIFLISPEFQFRTSCSASLVEWNSENFYQIENPSLTLSFSFSPFQTSDCLILQKQTDQIRIILLLSRWWCLFIHQQNERLQPLF